jgi:chromosome segregation ATPase
MQIIPKTTQHISTYIATTRQRGNNNTTMIGSNNNSTPLEQQFQQERELYVNKIEKLQEFIKSSALLVIEDISLVQIVQSKDAMEDIEGLRERIEMADSLDDEVPANRRSALTRKLSYFRSSMRSPSDSEGSPRSVLTKKAKLTPEEALSFAITSMRGSVQGFENSRDVLAYKMERLEAESKAKEERLTKELEDYKKLCEELQNERNTLSFSRREHLEDMETLQSLKDQVESLEGATDALEQECEAKQNEIHFLMTKELENKRRTFEQEQEQEIEDDFSSFSLLEEIKEERDALENQCQEQEKIIAELKKSQAGRFFRGRFDATQAVEQANNWRHEETKVKFQELQDAYLKLQTLSNDQKDTIQKLECRNATLRTEAEEFMLELEQGNTKCQSLSKAVVLFSEQEEELRQRIHNLEEVQQCMRVNKTQAESIAVLLRLTENQKDAETTAAWGRMTSKLDALEDDNERLSAKCACLEHSFETLKTQRSPELLNTRVEQIVLTSRLGPLQ